MDLRTEDPLHTEPQPEEQRLDPARQRRAKEYARLNRRLMLVGLAFSGLYALAWLAFGWAHTLRSWLETFTTNPWLLVPAFVGLFGLGYMLLDLPLTFYQGFVLPHRYDLSNQTLKGWIADQVKGLAVGAVIGLLVLEIIYAILRAFPETWWLWAAAFLLLFTVILANLAPVLLMPIFYKIVPLGDEHASLEQRLVRLAERAGTRVRGVYKFDMSRRTKAANAALTGLGSTRRIILGDTLINEFSEDEIETVLAHELGHHVHKDIPVGIAIDSLTTLLGLWLAAQALEWGVGFFGFAGVADPAAFPLFMLVMGLYGLVTMPLGNAYSRWRERRADAYALQATGKSRAYASAMTRLANQNLADADPEPWVVWLLYSHPPLSERIRVAEAYSEAELQRG
jgi:STE24 endopeptidase